jgi:RNA polymerase sigma-70 factor, ECF subfamily
MSIKNQITVLNSTIGALKSEFRNIPIDDIHDSVMDAFCLCLTNSSKEIQENNFKLYKWIKTTARRKLLKNMSRKTRIVDFSDEYEMAGITVNMADIAESNASYGPDIVDELTIEYLIEKLPLKLAELVILHYVEGYKYKEIANILKCSEESVKQGLKRSLIKMRKLLNIATP